MTKAYKTCMTKSSISRTILVLHAHYWVKLKQTPSSFKRHDQFITLSVNCNLITPLVTSFSKLCVFLWRQRNLRHNQHHMTIMVLLQKSFKWRVHEMLTLLSNICLLMTNCKLRRHNLIKWCLSTNSYLCQ